MNEEQTSKDNPKRLVMPKFVRCLDYHPEAGNRKDNETEPLDVCITGHVVTNSQIRCYSEDRKNQKKKHYNQYVPHQRVD